MYIHLGGGILIRRTEILAVLDLDNASWSYRTREFLAKAQTGGEVVNAAGDELPKSFVLCTAPGGGTRVCLSPYGSAVLARRFANPSFDTAL